MPNQDRNPTSAGLAASLAIPPDKRRGGGRSFGWLLLGLLLILLSLAAIALRPHLPRLSSTPTRTNAPASATTSPALPTPTAAPARAPGATVLTATGYLVPRERVELSARLPGTIDWIGVRKGDRVKQGDLLVRLEATEHQARLLESQGRLALAEAHLAHARTNHQRQLELTRTQVESDRALDTAFHALAAAQAEVTIAQGQLALAELHHSWCSVHAPRDATVLEKHVAVGELVLPQGFGGAQRPSTLLLTLADLTDLQVEVDLNELDTPKVHLQQPCRVVPEAYPDRSYTGVVAEIAPEANRQKGTLQVKVDLAQPDAYLVPDLNARVDFLTD
ncbi:MAG: efflux RND transporter periplasmic adaptor subunit [Verrucomicrobia bacterium]|nr:efflux RND transporter periplasmic adaptor subunit [Verrucomicrobiota bacterium]